MDDKRTEAQRKEKEKRLNEVALQWKSLPPEGNEAVIVALRNEMWLLSFELYDPKQENFRSKGPNADREYQAASKTFLDVFEEVSQKYLPENGEFSHYLSHVFKLRQISTYRKESRTAPTGVSIESGNEDGSNIELPSTRVSNPEVLAMLNARFAELGAMILNFSLTKKKDSETRRMWYRLFFTEEMTLAAKTMELSVIHERDIFKAMKLSYLDYYMSKKCRTLRNITYTPLKPYGDVVPKKKDVRAEPKLPLPADISLNYLQICEGITKGDTARSEQLKNYNNDKRHLVP